MEIPLKELGGAPIGWVTICLMETGYQPYANPDAVLKQGDFSWNMDNPNNPYWFGFPWKTNTIAHW